MKGFIWQKQNKISTERTLKNAWNAIKEELAVEDGTEPKKGVDKFEREI